MITSHNHSPCRSFPWALAFVLLLSARTAGGALGALWGDDGGYGSH